MQDACVFGIDISGCHHKNDSITISGHGIDKLLFKETLFLKKGELVEGCENDGLFKKYDKMILIPYDDYTISGKKPKTIIFTNDLEYQDLMDNPDIYFGNMQLCSSNCCQVLGFKSSNSRISKTQMMELISLRDSLLAQDRIEGSFYLSNDCCS
jgi:hypothetical protein